MGDFVLRCPKCGAKAIQRAKKGQKSKKAVCPREHVERRLNVVGIVLKTYIRTNTAKIRWI